MKTFFTFIILIIFNVSISAESISDRIIKCVIESSNKYNIPVELILAIIEVESNFNIYAINIEGQSKYFKNKVDLMREINSISKTNKSFDVGLMQINSWWFEKLGYSYEDGLNVCFNIDLGSYILAYEINKNGYNWNAIGRYHSKNDKRNKQYVLKIYNVLKKNKYIN